MKSKPVLILTDKGHVISLIRPNIQIHSPYKEVWMSFGQYGQDSKVAGFQVPGILGGPRVVNPQVGQQLFFWIHNLLTDISADQTIRRIYCDALNITPSVIGKLLGLLDYDGVGRKLLKNLQASDSTNAYLLLVLFGALNPKDSWTFDEAGSAFVRNMSNYKEFKDVDLKSLFECGLLIEDENGLITISDALKVLWMEAIHCDHPNETKFNEAGILEM